VAFFYLLIFLLLLFALIGVVLYFFTGVTKKIKFMIILSFLIGWFLIFTYTLYQNKKRDYHKLLLYHFKHGKVLICEDINITKDKFNFVDGTLTFVGKEESEFDGIIIPIDKCKIKDKR